MTWIAVFGLTVMGIYGVLSARTLLKQVIALQFLSKATLLALVTASPALGNVLAITVLVADTALLVLLLALMARQSALKT